MKITKEKVRILLLIIAVPLGDIGIDDFGLALISFQNMASKLADDIPEVFVLFLRKHDPIFHSRQKVNILPQFLIVNDSFVPSIVNIVSKVDHLRLLRYFVVEKWLFLNAIQPAELSEQQRRRIQPYSSFLIQDKTPNKISELSCLIISFISNFYKQISRLFAKLLQKCFSTQNSQFPSAFLCIVFHIIETKFCENSDVAFPKSPNESRKVPFFFFLFCRSYQKQHQNNESEDSGAQRTLSLHYQFIIQ